MKKIFLSLVAVTIAWGVSAQTIKIMNGETAVAVFTSSQYSKVVFEEETSCSAPVLSTAGRTSCDYVQLWAGGPKWATFNVGATITYYGILAVGADSTAFDTDLDRAPYYNTANIGGLYPWNTPHLNGRKNTWTGEIDTDINDVATALWGSNWKTPTWQQLDTLQSSIYGKTTWTWCDGDTVQYVPGCILRGFKVSGVGAYADKCIFLPVGGYYDPDQEIQKVSYAGRCVNYWSCSSWNEHEAYILYFQPRNRFVDKDYRNSGQTVRAILVE